MRASTSLGQHSLIFLAAQDGTRAMACIFMPFVQLRVMEVISAALTPSGPPICTAMLLRVTMHEYEMTQHCLRVGAHAINVDIVTTGLLHAVS